MHEDDSYEKEQKEFQELQKQIELLENISKKYLTKEAIQRYGNLKISHPEKAINAIALIVQLVNSGQITDKIDDNQFKEILKRMDTQKKSFKITKK